MAIHHAKPGEPVDVRPLGSRLSSAQTETLVKTDALEVIRLVLPAGKEIPGHNVPGELTLQCLEGRIALRLGDGERELGPGMCVYLEPGQEHSVRGMEASSALLTILLRQKSD